MADALNIARAFLSLASHEEEPMLLTHLHVQKLLYYAQGWHLAIEGNPLFDEEVRAWAHGPVVREVYDTFKCYGSKAIPETEASLSLSDDAFAFAESIWLSYRAFSAWKLRGMTHSEPPWKDARGGLPAGSRSDATISSQSMRDYFTDQYRRNSIPGLELEKLQKARKDFAEGRGVLLSQLKAARSG
jgi:uncharacterized phage-associated protein